MSEVITIARVYFGCGIVSTVDRLNNTTRHHECAPQRLFAWLTINTMLCVPYLTDSDTDSKIIKCQQRHCTSYNAIHITVSRIIHAIRFQSCGRSLHTPKELRALNSCWANGWRWHLAEAQAANDSVGYSSRLGSAVTVCVPRKNSVPWTAAERMGGRDT